VNPEVKTKWVAALRSGEYEQTTGTLSRDGAYCCLGVLCELAIKDGVEIEKHPTPGASTRYGESVGVLPWRVVSWAGVPDCDPDVQVPPKDDDQFATDEWQALSGVNDGGASFELIADLIEKSL
jgi:hypothetical protein